MKKANLEPGKTYMVKWTQKSYRSAEGGVMFPGVTRITPHELVEVLPGGYATVLVAEKQWRKKHGETALQVMMQPKGKIAVTVKVKRRVRTTDILKEVA